MGADGFYVASLGGAGGVESGVYVLSLDGGPGIRLRRRFRAGLGRGRRLSTRTETKTSSSHVPGANRVAVRYGQDAVLLPLAVGKSPSAAPGDLQTLNGDLILDLAVANRGLEHAHSLSARRAGGSSGTPPASFRGSPGRAFPVAKVAVRRGGCTVGRVTRKYSRVRKGRVIAQRPKAGTRLPAGASVALVLSRGPRR